MSIIVKGKVSISDKKSDVHGLKIEILDKDFLKNDFLGTTFANENGEYYFCYEEKFNLEQFIDGDLEIFIRVKDLNEQLLFKSKVYKCPSDDVLTINAKINPSKLKDIVLPKTVKNLNGGIVSKEVFGTVERAFEFVSDSQDIQTIQNLNAAFYCPLPPLHEFDNILDIAKDVITGNPREIVRFRELLQNFNTWQQPSGNQDTFRLSRSDAAYLSSDKFLDELDQHLKTEIKFATSRSQSVIPRENTILLLAATAVVSGNDQVALHENLGIINRQISGLKRVNRIYSSAEKVFSGNPEDSQYFLRTMKFFGDSWGPDDAPPRGPVGPWPNPEPDPFPWPPNRGIPLPTPSELEDLERWACTAEIVRAFKEAISRRVFYTITSISPERACPGDIITIEGTDFIFEGRTGNVIFETEEGTISVEPESWTDTQIRVRVPSRAICGPVSLGMPGATIIACGTIFDLFRSSLSTDIEFNGGRTVVKYVRITGLNRNNCIEPGQRFGVRWKACNADSIQITIRDQSGMILTNELLSEESGVSTFMIPISYNQTTAITVTLEISGPCGNDTKSVRFITQKAYNLTVDGMEVTQGIQFYNGASHLVSIQRGATNIPIGANNSLQLVTNKAAWVRVYLRSGQVASFESGNLQNVSGTLIVSRRVRGIWQNVGSIPSSNSITAQDSYAVYANERGNINSSLNFNVPAAWMTGLLRFFVSASSPDVHCGNGSATDSIVVNVNLQQTLQLAAIAIGYNGPNLDGAGNIIPGSNVAFPAPNNAAITGNTGLAMTMFPVSGNPNIRIIATNNATNPLNGNVPTGGCDPNWGPILNLVQNARNADGNQAGWFYYGFVTPQIPRSHGNVGCAGGNPAGLVGGGGTFAHEVAHQAGLPHAPCGAVGTPNGNYPRYNNYDNGVVNTVSGVQSFTDASIGEYGFNINTQNILNPATAKDFMSYCGPAWISIFTHQFLSNIGALNPVNVPTGVTGQSVGLGNTLIDENRSRNYIFVTGKIEEDNTVSILSITRASTLSPRLEGSKTNFILQSLDKEGKTIRQNYLFTLFQHHEETHCGCSSSKEKIKPPFYFSTFLLDTQNDEKLIIKSDKEVIWELTCPKKKPKISSLEASIKNPNNLSLKWKCTTEMDTTSNCWVRYSYDQGETWKALSVGVVGEQAELDITSLPPGKVKFQLIVHDGYYSATEVTDELLIEEKPPLIGILYPNEKETISINAPLHLWGTTQWLSDENTLEHEKCKWYINDKIVGQGRDIWVDNPGKGKHTILFKVHSSIGIVEEKINVEVA